MWQEFKSATQRNYMYSLQALMYNCIFFGGGALIVHLLVFKLLYAVLKSTLCNIEDI